MDEITKEQFENALKIVIAYRKQVMKLISDIPTDLDFIDNSSRIDYVDEFSVRTINVLRSMGIQTVGQLININWQKLRHSIKGLGDKTYNEIIDFINKYNG